MAEPTKPMGAVEQLSRALSPTHATTAQPRRAPDSDAAAESFRAFSDASHAVRTLAYRVHHLRATHEALLVAADQIDRDGAVIVEMERTRR